MNVSCMIIQTNALLVSKWLQSHRYANITMQQQTSASHPPEIIQPTPSSYKTKTIIKMRKKNKRRMPQQTQNYNQNNDRSMIQYHKFELQVNQSDTDSDQISKLNTEQNHQIDQPDRVVQKNSLQCPQNKQIESKTSKTNINFLQNNTDDNLKHANILISDKNSSENDYKSKEHSFAIQRRNSQEKREQINGNDELNEDQPTYVLMDDQQDDYEGYDQESSSDEDQEEHLQKKPAHDQDQESQQSSQGQMQQLDDDQFQMNELQDDDDLEGNQDDDYSPLFDDQNIEQEEDQIQDLYYANNYNQNLKIINNYSPLHFNNYLLPQMLKLKHLNQLQVIYKEKLQKMGGKKKKENQIEQQKQSGAANDQNQSIVMNQTADKKDKQPKRVLFKEDIALKTFNKQEEVTIMSAKQQIIQEVNLKQKLPSPKLALQNKALQQFTFLASSNNKKTSIKRQKKTSNLLPVVTFSDIIASRMNQTKPKQIPLPQKKQINLQPRQLHGVQDNLSNSDNPEKQNISTLLQMVTSEKEKNKESTLMQIEKQYKQQNKNLNLLDDETEKQNINYHQKTIQETQCLLTQNAKQFSGSETKKDGGTGGDQIKQISEIKQDVLDNIQDSQEKFISFENTQGIKVNQSLNQNIQI